jgi:hypothetical protein
MELEDRILALVQSNADLAPETAAGLATIGAGLAAQLASDLRGVTGPLIIPDDLYNIVSHRMTESVHAKLRDLHAELLLRRKRRKFARLRAAGYGSTCDHIEFARACLASPHETVPLPSRPARGKTKASAK